MYPVACLQRLALAINTPDFSDAVAALNDYYQWRAMGGFEPQSVCTPLGLQRGDVCADTLANMLATKLEPESENNVSLAIKHEAARRLSDTAKHGMPWCERCQGYHHDTADHIKL